MTDTRKPYFTAEDFSAVIDEIGDREFITSSYGDHELVTESIAECANARVQPLLEELKYMNKANAVQGRLIEALRVGLEEARNEMCSLSSTPECKCCQGNDRKTMRQIAKIDTLLNRDGRGK